MSSTSNRLPAGADAAGWKRDAKVIALVTVAHFTSHVHVMLLPPMLGLVRNAFSVSYVEIGAALTAFNVVSAALQTPAGFLVDRFGARSMLTGGLLLAALSLTVAALFPNYGLFVVAYAFLGLANTVYHPADYAILADAIDGTRIGKAFSIHNFSGYLGFGVAPALVLGSAGLWGWQGALLVAAALAAASALLLIVAGGVLSNASRKTFAAATDDHKPASVGLDLLMSAPVLRNLLFFLCIGMANGGIQTYSVVALGQLWGTAPATANIGLSGFLLMSAAGVLLGGIVADRTANHERVAVVGFAFTSAMAVLMGWVDMPSALLIFVMSFGGLLNGLVQPSRDMMVRAVTPVGSFGKVFGFVSTGLNIGGMVAPLLYGWLMDRGEPRMIFAIVVVFILLGMATAVTRRKPQGLQAWTR
jgi:MFS family permease